MTETTTRETPFDPNAPSQSEKLAASSWEEITKANDAELVRGTVRDEPKGFYASRRLRLRVTDEGRIMLWLDCFAHDWTIGHSFTAERARQFLELFSGVVATAEQTRRDRIAHLEAELAELRRDGS
jgi:hypothetical protein